jgi:hypothetical protein
MLHAWRGAIDEAAGVAALDEDAMAESPGRHDDALHEFARTFQLSDRHPVSR